MVVKGLTTTRASSSLVICHQNHPLQLGPLMCCKPQTGTTQRPGFCEYFKGWPSSTYCTSWDRLVGGYLSSRILLAHS